MMARGSGDLGWTRRRVLTWAAAAGGAIAAAGGLAGCAGGAAQSATGPAPQTTPVTTTLIVSIGFQGAGNYQGTMQKIIDEYISMHWLPTHPGVAVKTVAGSGSNGNSVGASEVLTNSLAGQVTDVVTGCCSDIQTYNGAHLLMPLDPLLRKANVDTSKFSQGHLAALQFGGAQLALPQYDGPEVMIYNQAILDGLGLEYPDPSWGYEDAYKLWSACTSKVKGKAITGVGLDTGDYNWLVHAWGGVETNDGTVAKFDSDQCAGAFTWMRDGQLAGVIGGGGSTGDIKSGHYAFGANGGWTIESAALDLQSMKWDYAPMPKFPGGPSTFVNNDFYAINQYTKNSIDLVWDIFNFIVLDDGFQKLIYQTTFVTPNRTDLWDAWIQIVRAVAPPLKNKHLEYYQGAMNYGWSNQFFKYNALTVQNLKGSWINKIYAQKVDVRLGLQQLTQQINAIETAGAAYAAVEASGAKKAATEFPTTGPSVAMVQPGL